MKTLVVYYSFDGNTKATAKKIAEELEAELMQLKPIKEIPREGFKKFMVGGMQALFGVCPRLEQVSIYPDRYDRIILGTPVWAGKCAPAINTFIKSDLIREKVSDVFTYSGSGENGRCISSLKKKLPNMKRNVSLTDRNNQSAKENEAKLTAFMEEIRKDGK